MKAPCLEALETNNFWRSGVAGNSGCGFFTNYLLILSLNTFSLVVHVATEQILGKK